MGKTDRVYSIVFVYCGHSVLAKPDKLHQTESTEYPQYINMWCF